MILREMSETSVVVGGGDGCLRLKRMNGSRRKALNFPLCVQRRVLDIVIVVWSVMSFVVVVAVVLVVLMCLVG